VEEITGSMVNGQALGSEDIKLSHRLLQQVQLERLPAIMLLEKSSLYTILFMGSEWLFQKGCPFLARRHEYNGRDSCSRLVEHYWRKQVLFFHFPSTRLFKFFSFFSLSSSLLGLPFYSAASRHFNYYRDQLPVIS